jgi:hypothetical protein
MCLFKHSKPWSIEIALQHLTGEVPTWPAQVLTWDGSMMMFLGLKQKAMDLMDLHGLNTMKP